MAFAGNPRKYARDIGDGYVLLTPVMLRSYDVGALRELQQALDLELRDVRGEVAPGQDLVAIQTKQRRILRLNNALRVIRTFAFGRRMRL